MSSSQPAPARPAQATLASWIIIFGGALVVVSSFEALANMGTLKTREAAERLLSGSPGLSGVGVESVLTAMRVSALIAAICAACAMVLAWFAWRRDRGARIGLSILGVPLLLTGLVSGGFTTGLVAVSILLLWMEPTRSWFAGRQPPARPERATRSGNAPGAGPTGLLPPRPDSAPASDEQSEPRRYQDFGAPQASPVPSPWPSAANQPGDWVAPAGRTPGPIAELERSRPGSVLIAVLVTWVFATLALISGGAAAVYVLADPEALMNEALKQDARLAEQGITIGMLQTTAVVMSVLLMLFSIAAIVFAMGLMLRKRWGAVGLIGTSLATLMFCVLAVLAVNSLMLVPGVAAVVVLAMMRRGDLRGWVLTAPKTAGAGSPGLYPPGPYSPDAQAPFGERPGAVNPDASDPAGQHPTDDDRPR